MRHENKNEAKIIVIIRKDSQNVKETEIEKFIDSSNKEKHTVFLSTSV